MLPVVTVCASNDSTSKMVDTRSWMGDSRFSRSRFNGLTNTLALLPRGSFNGNMKITMVPLLGVAVTWAFSPAWGAGEKYIKVDPTSGKPEYISKEDAKKVAGMPDDAKLCEIAFKDAKIPKVTGEGDEKKPENVDGYEFDCKPSNECKETNKGANVEKAKIKDEMAKQENIINPPKGKPKPGKKEKEAAEAKLKKLKERLAKFKPECTLKYFIGAGGKDPGEKARLTLDEIKADKIEHVVCTCHKLEIPGE